jgi:hypothetical protein
MLHGPTARLKAAADEKDGYTYVEAARQLWGLDADDEKMRRAHGLRGLLGMSEKPRKDDSHGGTGETLGA